MHGHTHNTSIIANLFAMRHFAPIVEPVLLAVYNGRLCPQTTKMQNPSAGAGRFDTTHWSLVLAAGQRGTVESAVALERLCQSYWLPLYAYVRRRVSDVHDAQDMTQGFFERLLDKNYLADADPQRGRFRVFC
ncbi:MAG: hypothetical protein IH991_06005 [Planctomycetes bacterium]|nr:hypothetical protein [Planctomycetota bacterium]